MNKIKAFLPVWFIFLLVYIPLYSQTWETYTCKNDVQDLCCVGDYCWVATTGGVVKVNINDFSFEEFEAEEGLSSSNIKAVTSDNNNIWFGSLKKGISLKTDQTWAIFNSKNSGLMNNNINCLITDSSNRIWIGSCNGVFVFDGENWTNYKDDDFRLNSNVVLSLNIDSEGKVWVGTEKGIAVYDGISWQSFTTLNSELQSNGIYDISFDSNNKVWLATQSTGVHSFQNDQFVNYDQDNSGLLDNYIKTAFVDSKNKKWFGSLFGRVYCYNDTSWTIFDSTNCILPFDSINTALSPLSAHVNAITEDKHGNLWVGGTSGLYIYNGTVWRKVIISGELQSNYIQAAIADRENRIWVTSSIGVYMCENNNWNYFDVFSDAESENPYRLAMDYKGQIWASWELGLFVWDGSLWKIYNYENSTFPTTIISALAVEDSIMWLGSWAGDGIIEYNGADFITHCDPDGKLSNTAVLAIAVDSQKNKWVGTSDLYWGKCWGVARYDGANWAFFNKNNSGIASNNVEAIAVEDNGCIWFGTPRGVSCFDGENWITYNSDNSGLSYDYVFNIVIDKQGQKWFGTYRHGLCMFDGENWTAYTKENSNLVANGILSLSVDNYDNILIGTENGFSIFKQMETGIKQKTQPLIPKEMNMLQNYPNPFNSETKIQYHLSQKGHVKIQVYNIYGQLVTTLWEGMQTTGSHTAHWQGVNYSGETVASGIYFYRLTFNGQQIETRRLVFLK